MGNGAWSNDQANQLFVYDAKTGTVILQVDSTGLYYLNIANGSYFKVTVSPYPQDNGAVAIFLNPGASSIPGVTYAMPGYIIGGEYKPSTPGQVYPELFLQTPNIAGKASANLFMLGQSNTSTTDDSEIHLDASLLQGNALNEIGQGTLDEGSGFSNNFTGTEIVGQYVSEAYGAMLTTRRYAARFVGTAQSTVSGDRIGLRIYVGPNNNNLTGATLICDYGQLTVPAANIGVPFNVEAPFNGAPGKYILLGARRTSGSGTCSLTINYRRAEDAVGAY